MTQKTNRAEAQVRLQHLIFTLKDEIDSGKRQFGDFLPSEIELIKQFQLSKNTVRKGLEVLVQEGYIEKIPRIGTRVCKQEELPKLTLKFGYHLSLEDETNILEMVARFQQLHPHIRVLPVPIYYKKYSAIRDYLQQELVDVISVNAYNFEFLKQTKDEDGMLEPLEVNERIYPFLLNTFTQEEQLYVQPFVFAPVILCYNKEHFIAEKLDEPDSSWTWDHVKEVALQLSNEDRSGLYFHYVSDNRWPNFLLQNNVRFQRNEQGEYDFTNKEFTKTLQFCQELIRDRRLFAEYASESSTDVRTLFLSEKVSMIVTSYSGLNGLKQAPFQYDVSPLPHFGKAKTSVVTIGLAINKHSAQKAAAQMFIDFMLSYENQLFMRKNTLSIPALKPAAEWTGDTNVNQPSRFHMYREIIPTFTSYEELNINIRDVLTISNELKLFWSGLERLPDTIKRLSHLFSAENNKTSGDS